jgi:hypothetical protein
MGAQPGTLRRRYGRRVTTCAGCGATPDGEDDDGTVPLGWSHSVEERGVVLLCAACTRTHVRAIEAKLDAQWW